MRTNMPLAAQIIKKLLDALLKEDTPEHSGVIMLYGEQTIDDRGGYGDVDADNRPDFVKEDESGWISIHQ